MPNVSKEVKRILGNMQKEIGEIGSQLVESMNKTQVTHELKTWPEPFHAVASGLKTFEIRKNDREFEVGDILVLKEFKPKIIDDLVAFDSGLHTLGKYTGRQVIRRVTYMTRLSHWAAVPTDGPTYVVMSLEIATAKDIESA